MLRVEIGENKTDSKPWIWTHPYWMYSVSYTVSYMYLCNKVAALGRPAAAHEYRHIINNKEDQMSKRIKKLPRVSKDTQQKLGLVPVGTIYATTNYDSFVFAEHNRDVDLKRAGKMSKSISNGAQPPPITTQLTEDNLLEIEDGQHRFTAFKNAEAPVYLYITEGFDLSMIQEIQTAQRSWSVYNWLESWCKKGKKEYLKLKDFITKHNISIELGRTALSGIQSGQTLELFKLGKFKQTFPMELAERAIQYVKDIDAECYENLKAQNYLLRCVMQLIEGNTYNHDKFMKKLKTGKHRFYRKSNVLEYMRQFEDIYNHGLKAGSRVSFSKLNIEGE